MERTEKELGTIAEGACLRISEPKIRNVAVSFSVGVRLDLKVISMQIRNTEYDDQRVPMVILRLRYPKTTALVFASGKLIVTGARSVTAAIIACRRYARLVQRLGFDCRFLSFRVENIVSSVDIGCCVDLYSLAFGLAESAFYDPSVFPGVICRVPTSSRVVFLFFSCGMVVSTGAKSTPELIDSIEQFNRALSPLSNVANVHTQIIPQ